MRVIAQRWFACLRQSGDDVRELLHDGLATACVNDAPFAHVGVFTHHINLGFFHDVELADPAGLLQGTGKSMRHVKIKPGMVHDEAALEMLIEAAYRDILTRLALPK
jgi:hypothetical protein